MLLDEIQLIDDELTLVRAVQQVIDPTAVRLALRRDITAIVADGDIDTALRGDANLARHRTGAGHFKDTAETATVGGISEILRGLCKTDFFVFVHGTNPFQIFGCLSSTSDYKIPEARLNVKHKIRRF